MMIHRHLLSKGRRNLSHVSFVPPRGTHDTFHDVNRQYRHIKSIIQHVVEKYGVDEIQTPTLDHLSLFDRALGKTTDVVSKEMYELANTSPTLVLRPEGTASVARALLNEKKVLPHLLPCKVYYDGSFYRRERPQKGRYRQFNQFGVEMVGCHHWLDDVECILMGYQILKALGLHQSIELKINSLGDTTSRITYKNNLINWLKPHMNSLSSISRDRINSGDVLRVLDSKREEDQRIINRADRPLLSSSWNDTSKERFYNILNALKETGYMKMEEEKNGEKKDGEEAMNMIHDESLVRGLDYYCHTAFEFVIKEGDNTIGKNMTKAALGRQQGTVLAGGRYDSLYNVLSNGKHDVPSIGWAIGVDRVHLMMNRLNNISPPKKFKIGIVPVNEKEKEAISLVQKVAFQICDDLRNCNNNWNIITNNNHDKLKKQMKYANQQECNYVIIVGESELINGGGVSIKNMKTSEQFQVNVEDVVHYLSALKEEEEEEEEKQENYQME
jgi:histidyl-tRNA synthetase